MSQGPGGELERGGFALDQPRVAVAVENALTQEIVKRGLPRGTFRVVVEPGSEHVLDVLGVARDGVEPLPTRKKGNANGGGLVGVCSAGRAEVSGHPIVESPPVEEERRKASDDGPDFWAGEFTSQEKEPKEIR